MSRRRAARGVRRKSDWGSASLLFAGSTNGSQNGAFVDQADWVRFPAGVWDPTTEYSEIPNCTLVRSQVHSYGLIRQSNASGVGDAGVRLEAWMGLIAWPSAGGLAVPAEIPTPENGSWPWIWRQYQALYTAIIPTLATVEYNFAPTTDTEMESKAQRKLPDNMGLLAVLSFVGEGMNSFDSSTTVTWNCDMRYLCKLP